MFPQSKIGQCFSDRDWSMFPQPEIGQCFFRQGLVSVSSEIGQCSLWSRLASVSSDMSGQVFLRQRLVSVPSGRGWPVFPQTEVGGISGVLGCLEHATMIWEAIQRSKSEKLNLDVVWLDLSNTYGLVPYEMIQLTLRIYHVPEVIQVMLDDYFSGF
ncbi:reverse transcriptase [Plakobranchus ocellatus]|uniref:Reverse transcriptase n=1 Tax=Plakobranchus ocellatus TaxID=259542 RepID=A0AAV4ABG0_9GAST|nr:reverse transcriptase [Plakobranchus ocellatus]